MGASQRRKGYRGENELVKKLKAEGFDAKRIPLSGATYYKKGDIEIEDFTGEVKLRKDGFKKIYEWLGDNDFLFIKADRKQYLVVMELEMFTKLLKRGNVKCGSKE